MAGIFANIDSDISKLRQLKAEIEKVKNALKSINVRVDIDIARGLEEKLKSLTGQYDALVQKVSQAEGKIIASTQRINQAAEKIVKAQEQLAKASGVQSNASSNGGTMAAANQAETASVQAQAKAYDELADEIDAVMGTRSQNIKRMLEEQNAIRLINAEIKNLTKYQGDNASMSSSQQRRLEQLNASLMKHKTALSELRQSLNNSFKLDNSAATSMNALSQSLGRMRMAYRELTEEERKSPFGQELLASIQQADAKIKQLDATIGNHQRNVGNYASGWNGLSMSIQQIGRELPSLAMGWNTFFLAISNNLPILSDEISRARKEYEMLKKSGQSATPVWKQVVSSLLSWQTALTVGITLLTLYGDEIIEWVKGLFSAESATRKIVDVQGELNKVSLEGAKNAQEEKTKLDILYRATQNASLSMEKRKAAIEELQRVYPKYFENFSEEEILAGKASAAYDRLSKSIVSAAKAKAAFDMITQQQNIVLENEQKITDAYARREPVERRMDEFRKREQEAASRPYGDAGLTIERKDIEEELRAIDEEIAGYRSAIFNANKLSKELEESIDVTDLIGDTGGGNGDGGVDGGEDRIKNAEDVAKQLLALRRKNQEDEIDLMEEGREKKLAQIRLEYEEELAEIDRQEKEMAEKQGGTITLEQRVVLSQARENAFELRNKAISDLGKEEEKEEKERLQKLLEEYQDYTTKYKSALDKFEKDRKDLVNAGATDEQFKELEYQKEETLKAINEEFAGREESFNAWADNVVELSLGKLRELLNAAYQEMMNMEISDPNNANLGTVRAKVGKLRDAISQKELEKEISPGKATKDWDKLYDVLSEVNDVFKEIGDTMGGTLGEIISMVGEAASGSMQLAGAIKGVSAAVSGLEKASAILAAISAAMKVVSGISGFFKEQFGADYSGYEEMKSRYDTLIDVWDELIDKKMEYISIDYGAEAAKAADEAAQLVGVNIERQRQLIKQLAASGSGWGSHSLGYRINDRLNSSDYERISELVGQKITAEYQLWDLSEQQMGKLLTDERLVTVLGEVNGEFITYIQNIAAYGDQLDEIADKEREALTGIGLDEFRSGYEDMLADLDATNKDFADSFEEYLRQAVLSSLVADQYKDRIDALYGQWASYSESGDRITADEAARLREEQDALVTDMLAERDRLMEAFGWDASAYTPAQQASSAVTVQASQESIDEGNGRLLAIQETGLQMLTQTTQQGLAITDIKGNIIAISASMLKMENIGENVRDILADSYLELVSIRENTGAIVKPIQQMQLDIEQVKQNTSRI